MTGSPTAVRADSSTKAPATVASTAHAPTGAPTGPTKVPAVPGEADEQEADGPCPWWCVPLIISLVLCSGCILIVLVLRRRRKHGIGMKGTDASDRNNNIFDDFDLEDEEQERWEADKNDERDDVAGRDAPLAVSDRRAPPPLMLGMGGGLDPGCARRSGGGREKGLTPGTEKGGTASCSPLRPPDATGLSNDTAGTEGRRGGRIRSAERSHLQTSPRKSCSVRSPLAPPSTTHSSDRRPSLASPAQTLGAKQLSPFAQARQRAQTGARVTPPAARPTDRKSGVYGGKPSILAKTARGTAEGSKPKDSKEMGSKRKDSKEMDKKFSKSTRVPAASKDSKELDKKLAKSARASGRSRPDEGDDI